MSDDNLKGRYWTDPDPNDPDSGRELHCACSGLSPVDKKLATLSPRTYGNWIYAVSDGALIVKTGSLTGKTCEQAKAAVECEVRRMLRKSIENAEALYDAFDLEFYPQG